MHCQDLCGAAAAVVADAAGAAPAALATEAALAAEAAEAASAAPEGGIVSAADTVTRCSDRLAALGCATVHKELSQADTPTGRYHHASTDSMPSSVPVRQRFPRGL